MTFMTACGPEEAAPCVEHLDTDANSVCDVCGASLTPECAGHKDENADKLCDTCGAEFFPRCTSHTDSNLNYLCDVCGKDLPMDVKFTLKDQEGNIIPGVTVIVYDGEELEEYTFVTDDYGAGTLKLYSGTYSVSYDTTSEGVYFPEGYIAIPSTVVVSASNRDVIIEVINNIPNGEADRPFPIDAETEEILIPAATVFYYIIYHSSGRNVVFEGADFKVTYGDKTYVPDSEGRVAFTLAELEANENSHLLIENSSDSEIKIKFVLYADPGSYGNPFEITSGESSVTASVASGGVYYKYVAGADGRVILSTAQPLMFKSSIMADAKPLTKVSEDDSATVWMLDTGSVIYTVTIAEDSITIEDDSTTNSISGTYTYTVSEEGQYTLTKGEAVLDLTLFKGGNTIVATNSSNSKQTVISGAVESMTVDVNEGDEIRILVNSEYSDEVTFEIALEEKVG